MHAHTQTWKWKKTKKEGEKLIEFPLCTHRVEIQKWLWNSLLSSLSSLAIILFIMYLLLYIKSSTNINSPFHSLPSEAIGFHKSWKSKKLLIQICTVYYHKSIINPDITAKHCSSYCKALNKESKTSLKSHLWKGDPRGGKAFFFSFIWYYIFNKEVSEKKNTMSSF